MTTYDWPTELRDYISVFNHLGATISGGRSIGGYEQVVSSPANRWFASVTVPVNTRARRLAFRALKGKLQGRANAVRVGPRHRIYPPWGTDSQGRLKVPGLYRRPHLDGTTYADDIDTITDGLISAEADANAALNATSIAIDVTDGGALEAGQFFSLDSGDHLHSIVEITNVASSVYTCTIWPWLRAAISTADPVVFPRPTCAMRFTGDDGGMETGASAVTMQFEEVL